MSRVRPFTLALGAPVGAPWLGRCRTDDGRPGVDARVVRRALRVAYEGLLRASGMPEAPVRICRGGDGADPREAEPATEGPCALNAGAPCLACQLFGTRDGGRPALVVGEAQLDEGGLRVEGRLVDRDDGRLGVHLQAAVTLVSWLGPFGPVAPTLRWTQTEAPADSAGGDLRLVIDLVQPAAFPGAPAIGVQPTARALPGASLRGAVATALHDAEAGEGPGITRLLDEGRFDFAWPCDDAAEPFPGPWPLTARVCSHDPGHAAHDVLFDRIAVRLAGTVGEQWSVESRLARLDVCPTCGAPMGPRAGSRGRLGAAPTHVVRAGRSTVERLDAGVRLLGSIRGVPAAARRRLAAVLGGPITFGRGRAQGWGRAAVQVLPALGRPGVSARAVGFRACLRERLRGASLLARADGAAATVVAITLLAPLLPDALEDAWGGRSDGADDLLAALAAGGVDGAAVMLSARRFETVAGFSRDGRRPTWRVVTAGSVFVFTVPPGQDATLFEALGALEREGVGRRRHQGFGRVLAFDPGLCAPDPDQMGEGMASLQDSARDVALAAAAQEVLTEHFAGAHGGRRTLTEVALQRLAVVADAATCHEAVAHWLRGRAADAGPWSAPLGAAVVAGIEAAPGFAEAESDERLAAWHAYVTFLGQAFGWLAAVERESR